MIEKITDVLSDTSINIEEMVDKSKGNIAYNIIDVSGEVTTEIISKLEAIEGIIKVRKI